MPWPKFIVIEQDVSLDAAFGAAELRPRQQVEAQRDGGRIQRQQLILEAKFRFARTQPLLLAETRQGCPEQILKQGRRPVLVGIRQGGSAGRFGDAEMHQTAQTTRQAVADLAQGIRTSQLQKSMATNCVQQANPLAACSPPCFFTRAANSVRGKCWSS